MPVKPGDEGDTANLSRIKVVFCDLDNPHDGTSESFERDVRSARRIRGKGVHVVYATRNNLALAQAKFGKMLGVSLREHPGIYCNGALVLGARGMLAPPVAITGGCRRLLRPCGGRDARPRRTQKITSGPPLFFFRCQCLCLPLTMALAPCVTWWPPFFALYVALGGWPSASRESLGSFFL